MGRFRSTAFEGIQEHCINWHLEKEASDEGTDRVVLQPVATLSALSDTLLILSSDCLAYITIAYATVAVCSMWSKRLVFSGSSGLQARVILFCNHEHDKYVTGNVSGHALTGGTVNQLLIAFYHLS